MAGLAWVRHVQQGQEGRSNGSDEELAAQPSDLFVGKKQIVGKSKIREEHAVVALRTQF